MWTFQYKHGDRPLEGFTIQRAAGRGGFGEVYYAISDSGREVALKVVQGYEQIELRGISQCMNLKSPHLVTIFDVKYNAEGRPFVIMEFVAGLNLRQILDESPAGLGTQKAAFFLREIGKGLTFLHDCGIVHRDLKPANIFFENGYVKIGDYGLSKAISPNQHSGQTVTVGTVHYMAPEVGVGKYDRSIDIYALGAVLYEMLTGTVPFIGASPSEILMKHLSAEPDMSGVPEPFGAVVRKAMAKDPAQRYQSVQEMVEAVFGAEHVRMSVSHFSPDDLSMVAGRVAQKIALGGGGGIGGGAGGSSSVVGNAGVNLPPRMGAFQQPIAAAASGPKSPFRVAGERLKGLADSLAAPIDPNAPPLTPPWINDPLPFGSRALLGALTAGVVAIAAGVLSGKTDSNPQVPLAAQMLFVFTAICGASIGTMVAWWQVVFSHLRNESQTVRRLAVAGIVCLSMFVCSGIFWLAMGDSQTWHTLAATWIPILVPLVFMDTWQWARADRRERICFGAAARAGLFAYLLCLFFHGDAMLAVGVLAGSALAVQATAPWDPVRAAKAGVGTGRLGRRFFASPGGLRMYGNVTLNSKEAEAMRTAGGEIYGNVKIADEAAPSSPPPRTPQTPQPLMPLSRTVSYRPVPRFAPPIWLGCFVVLLTLGLVFLIGAASDAIRSDAAPLFVSWGIGACMMAIFCFVRIFGRRFWGWWSYLIRPGLMLACVETVLMSGILLGCSTRTVSPSGQLIGAFFIIFPVIVFFVLPFLPRTFGAPVRVQIDAMIPSGQSAAPNLQAAMQPPQPRQSLGIGHAALSILAGMLTFASAVVALMIGLALPRAVMAGLPDAQTSHDIHWNLFGNDPNWAQLAEQMLWIILVLLAAAAVALIMLARRRTTTLHILRGVMGLVGMLLAVWMLTATFYAAPPWMAIAACIKAHQSNSAAQVFFQSFQGRQYPSVGIWLGAVLLLSIPPHRRGAAAKGIA